jgi:hypothetical protein
MTCCGGGGITLIEDLVNTAALPGPHTFLCAAPLLVPGRLARPRTPSIEDMVA